MARQHQARQPQFHGPPFVDRSPGIFHDLHRAWQSIDILKEKLQRTEKKLQTIGDEPLDLAALGSGPTQNGPWKATSAAGGRKRKVFRLEDKEWNGRPKPEVSERPLSHPKTKKEVRWSAVDAEDEKSSWVAAPNGQFGQFGRDSPQPPDHFLNTAAFDQFKRGEDEPDLFLVPIRPLNDPIVLKSEPFGQRSLQQNGRLTHVDVHLVRPPGGSFALAPPSSPPPLPVSRDKGNATSLSSSTLPVRMPPPEMMWVPIEPPAPRRTSTQPKVEDHGEWIKSAHLPPFRLTSGQRLPTPALNAADKLTKRSAGSDIITVKKASTGKALKRKKSRCLPSNIQQSVINPYSWRRGQELVIKELGPFVKPSRDPAHTDSTISNEEPEKDTSNSMASVPQLPKDSGMVERQKEKVKSGDDHMESTKTVPEEARDSSGGSLPSRHEAKISGKPAAKKPSRLKRNPAEDEVKESTPKTRHYDAVSIRRYIKAQREDRKRKMKEEAISQKSSKEQQRQKLEELRARQRVLAKVAPPVAKNPGAAKTTGTREEWQWTEEKDLGSRDGDKDSGFQPADQDYIWDQVLYAANLPVPRKKASKRSKDRKRLSSTSGTLSTETSKSSEFKAPESPLADPDPKAHGDEDRRPAVNERLQSLSALFENQTEVAMKAIQHSKEKRSKLMSIQQQALLLQELIDEETKRVSAKFQPRWEAPGSGQPDGQGCGDAPAGLSLGQRVAKLVPSEKDHRSADTSLSEGSLHSRNGQWSSGSESAGAVQRRIAINTIVAKSELRFTQNGPGEVKERDWRSRIPRETPDPYSFFNALRRKQRAMSGTGKSLIQNSDGIQGRGTAAPIPETAPAEPDQPEHVSYFPSSSLALVKPEDSEPEKLPETPAVSSASKALEAAVTPESSVSLSQHMLTSDLAHSDTDDQLSEGTLDSISDISQVLGTSSQRRNVEEQLTESEPRVGDENVPADGRLSIQSEQRMSRESPTRDSCNLAPSSKLHSGEMDSGSLKMSPNTLHLRMTTELSFLDNVQASLGQLQDLERIRSVSIAQQELAQVVQAKQSQKSGTTDVAQPLVDSSGSTLHKSTIELLKSQAEVTRISAEATKQLTEINKSIVEQRSRQAAGSQTAEAVAAATAAAVTAALSQLKQALQQQKARSHRAESTDASRSLRQSSFGEEATESSASCSSGNSQTRGGERASQDDSRGMANDVSSAPHSGTVLENTGTENEDRNSQATEHQVVEERSYRMLLPSESHRRSSLGGHSQRMASPGSDLSKNSSISEALSVGSEVPPSPTNADGAGLFSGENSFQRFTLGMVKQYMEEEGMRTHHQKAIMQLQEEASLRQTQDEMAWNKLHKKQNRVKGEDDRMPSADGKKGKSTSGKPEKAGVKAVVEAARKAQDVAPIKGNGGAIGNSLNVKAAGKTALSSPKSKKNDDVLLHSDPVSSITDKFSSSDIKSELSASTQDDESEAQVAARSNNNGKSKMLALPSSPSTTRVLQGLKKLQVSKRYLTKREQKLLQRRKNVEELLRWQRELDQEELKVQEMEAKALEILGDKRQVTVSEAGRGDETSSCKTQEASTKMGSSPSSQRESVVEQLASGQPSETSLPEELSAADSADATPESVSAATVTKLEESPKASTFKSGESASTYSKETFEKLSVSKTEAGSGDAPVCATSVSTAGTGTGSPQSSPKSKSIVLRSPLTPIRTLARKRCDSSGSEDSCTISQSETASEPSDIEGRIHALKKDLRQRKSEAERLKKEQKRKNVERLKEQEASLLKQIEAYDRYIYQAKLDLQKELEQDGGAKMLVKPVIMQPKVAESKRLQRQSALDKSPEQDDKRISAALKEATAESPRGSDSGQAPGQRPREVAESGEESFESVRSNSSIDELLPAEAPKESEEDGSNGSAVSGSAVEENKLEPSEGVTTERERCLDDVAVPALKTFSENAPDDQDTDQSNIPALEEDGDDTEDARSDRSTAKTASSASDRTVQEELSAEEAVGQPEPASGDASAETDQAPKKDSRRDALADEITEHLMRRLVADATERLKARAAEADRPEEGSGQTGDVAEATQEKEAVVKAESADPGVGLQVAEHLLEKLLDEALAVALSVRRGSGAKDPSGRNCPSANCPKEGQTPSVHARVSSIMAEITERQLAACAGTRQQDLLVLSFNEDLVVAPHKGRDPPLKSDPSSPVRRPSSPVFGEPGELSPLDLEARLLSLQAAEGQLSDPDDLLVSEEWFEDDFGLAASPIQHYQIYPYQDSYYIREIPNKPPPPYTPPGQASLAAAPAPFDPRSLFRPVTLDDDGVRQHVARAAELLCGQAGPAELPDGFFAGHDQGDDLFGRSRRVYDRFLGRLTEEIVDGLRGGQPSPRPPWMRPEWPSRARAPQGPEELVSAAQARALELLSGGRSAPRVLIWGRKKRDFVDELLLQELRREEAYWVSYDADEAAVKNQLTEAICEQLLEQLVADVGAVWAKREGRR